MGQRCYVRSKFEEKFAANLKKRGVAYKYEEDHFVYSIPRKYNPDFKIVVKGKTVYPSVMYIETKGYFTPGDRAKTLAVLSAHPNLDLRFVFQNAKSRLSKESKTTYAMWCDKQGIMWAEGTIPDAWLK